MLAIRYHISFVITKVDIWYWDVWINDDGIRGRRHLVEWHPSNATRWQFNLIHTLVWLSRFARVSPTCFHPVGSVSADVAFCWYFFKNCKHIKNVLYMTATLEIITKVHSNVTVSTHYWNTKISHDISEANSRKYKFLSKTNRDGGQLKMSAHT